MTVTPAGWRNTASLAEAIFVASESIRGLNARGRAVPAPVVTFNDIYRYATDPAASPNNDLSHVFATDARAREDLRCLLARVTPYRPLTRAAASSGAVTTRSGSGYEITLRESRADRNQLYVIIKLAGNAVSAPCTLFVIGDGEGCRKVPLPKPIDGVIQLLLDTASDLAAALCNPKADVFLR